ncbi:hypothetical protein DPMN_118423 [Dreissena polymorpha]|uniref:Uncharacterized protein n=1 Tax=Dreissena polymorpha TaxID=45954 RepID=A0A9D4GK34_DREPO|nr:hypothetical protein DPMN_118423 [Dreissena polymorpha]
MKVRTEGKRTSFVYDRLNVDYTTFTVDKLPQAQHPINRHNAPRHKISMQVVYPVTEHCADLQ